MPRHRSSLFLVVLILLGSPANAQVPRSAQDYFNRGWDQFNKGDFERAAANFTRVIEVDRLRKAGVRSGHNWNGSDASESDRIILVSRLTAPAYINRGLARFHTGDIDGALSDCDQALAIHPGLVQVYRNRGAIRWNKGDLDGAIADFNQVIQKNPRDAQAYSSRGNIRAEKGDLSGLRLSLIVRMVRSRSGFKAMSTLNHRLAPLNNRTICCRYCVKTQSKLTKDGFHARTQREQRRKE